MKYSSDSAVSERDPYKKKFSFFSFEEERTKKTPKTVQDIHVENKKKTQAQNRIYQRIWIRIKEKLIVVIIFDLYRWLIFNSCILQ